jgi:hypothetical protein
MEKYKHRELTDKIIQAFYSVYNELGYGFLENVYQNALYFELQNKGFKVEPQKAIDVYYQTQLVGKYKEIGLLLNFGTKPEIRRKAFNNERKNLRKSLKSASSAC